MQNILYNRSEKIDIYESEIFLGDQYQKIIGILGAPIEHISKRKFDILYELVTFELYDIKYKLFFKDKILIDAERAKWKTLNI